MRSTTWDIVFLAVLAPVIVYSAMNAWFSDSSGGKHIGPLSRENKELRRQISALDVEIAERERLNELLKAPEVDLELFEERIRAAKGSAHPNEVLLIAPKDDPAY